jgi:hypothetical protein
MVSNQVGQCLLGRAAQGLVEIQNDDRILEIYRAAPIAAETGIDRPITAEKSEPLHLLTRFVNALEEVGLKAAQGVESAGAVGELSVLGGGLDAADQFDGVVDVVAEDLEDGLHDEWLAAGHAQRGRHVVFVEAVWEDVAGGGFF